MPTSNRWAGRSDAQLFPRNRDALITQTASTLSLGAIDRKIVDQCAQAAQSAGLRLDDQRFALLCNAAPRLLEMIDRVRGWQQRPSEPASVFIPRSVQVMFEDPVLHL